MNNLDKLIRYFEQFPGIGARQAKRFAFHILTLPPENASELSNLIVSLQDTVVECESCRRFFSKNGGATTFCSICNNSERDFTKLMIVESDSDVQAVERAGIYDGLYFVLGGTVPLLNSKENTKLRGGALKNLVATRVENNLTEIILAFAINPDGENTSRFVESILKEFTENTSLKISHLGRGLSTGSELEYADPETIKNALQNRN